MRPILRDLADLILRGIRSEAKYRQEHPDEVAAEFRRREKYWLTRGRRVLARIAARRAERWEARARQKAIKA